MNFGKGQGWFDKCWAKVAKVIDWIIPLGSDVRRIRAKYD